jgi:DNA-binding Xre family transcriptional regulator
MKPVINKQFVQGRLMDQRRPQREFANIIGLDPAAMSKLLQGKREIAWHEAALICKTLKCSMADLGLVLGEPIEPRREPRPIPPPPANSTSIQLMGGYEVQIIIKEVL